MDPFNDSDDSFFAMIPDVVQGDNDEDAPPAKKLKQEGQVGKSGPPDQKDSDKEDPFGDSTDDDIFLQAGQLSTEQLAGSHDDETQEPRNGMAEHPEMFEDEDDDFMAEAAEAMELHHEGAPPQNRFKTGIGRPHPLLVPHIYETVLSLLDSPRDILSCRLVNHSWNTTLIERTGSLTVRNVNHVVEQYPYGLGFDEHTRTWSTPLLLLGNISGLHVADPCMTLKKPAVSKYFERCGLHIKRLTFDANMYCTEHWNFMRRVLTMWCDNLEQLELIGVSCTDALLTYSGLNSYRRLKLTTLTIKCDRVFGADHHHYSTITKLPHRHRQYVINRMGCSRDGGLLSALVKLSSSSLTTLVFHFNFESLQTYIAHMRVFQVNFSFLRTLELVGVANSFITSRDLRVLRSCNLTLTDLRMGPIGSFTQSRAIEAFLRTQSTTLVSLQFVGGVTSDDTPERLGTVRFTLPTMPKLKHLKICDVSRYRIRDLSFIVRFPLLESVHFGSTYVPAELEHHVATYVHQILRSNTPPQHQSQHTHLRSFEFVGAYGHVVKVPIATVILTSMFANLNSLSLCVSHLNAFKEISVPLPGITRLTIGVSPVFTQAVNWGSVDFDSIRAVFKDNFKSVEHLTLWCVPGRLESRDKPSNSNIKLEHCWWGPLRQLVLDRFTIYDSDSEVLARGLAERTCSTTFVNCKVVKRWNPLQSPAILNSVALDLVNLHVLIDQYFHVI